MRELATTVLELMGNPVEPEFGALPERPTEILRMRADATRARERLGWAPKVSLREGLETTIAWYTAEFATGASSFAP